METDQARHETEESLILAQFGSSHHISAHKLQNGGQSSEEESLQITGDTNWNHYKPSVGTNSMKRHRESCDSPASVHGLFEQGSYMINGDLMNGELKNALTEQSLLVHQSKKLKINPEIKGNDGLGSSLLDNFPEITKATEFECNTPPMEIKLDKRNCSFPNGDVFSFPQTKQVPIPNGAVSPPSTIESTQGDLLEKTLSQYYPEQVSIAPQTSRPQLDSVNGSTANKPPSAGAQPPSLTSGQPNSAQMPDLQQQRASSNVEGGNNFNPVNYLVNGYSDHHQQQRQHPQQPPSYPGKDMTLGHMPGMIPPRNMANGSQHQNGPQCYQNETNPPDLFTKSKQEFNQDSYLERHAPLQVAEAGGYRSFPNSGMQKMGQNEESEAGRHDTDRAPNYGIKPQTLNQNGGNPSGADSMGSTGPPSQQSQHSGLENGMESLSQQRANLSRLTPHQRGWMEMNSSNSQQQPPSSPSSQAQGKDMWRGFPAKPQLEQQTANLQVHCQMLEPNPVQRFQTQGVYTDSSQGSSNYQQQQQDCLPAQTPCAPAQHNTAPEWQQSNSKALQMQQPVPQKMPEQRKFPPNQQADSRFHAQMQSEHLSEDPDLQEILSPGFLPTQPQQQQQQHSNLQRPLSQPPQYEGQQLKSPNYRPHSQPHPGQQQLQQNQSLRNSSNQPVNQQLQHNDHAMFSYNNTTEMQQIQQHQRHYTPNSGTSNLKQFQPQRPNNHHHQLNHMDISQTSAQSQSQLPQGGLNQQVSTPMYPKAEQQLKVSCAQFQRGPRLPLGPPSPHGDFQRHAALRMHLLQRQERQGPPHLTQSISDCKQGLRPVKMENGPRFEVPSSPQQNLQLQMQDAGIAGMQVKQENQQSLCEQSKRQGSILASMEQTLRQYQLSPVFEKKSLVINSSNKVKVESSGPVTILSTNTDLSGVESSEASSAKIAPKKPPDCTPKKEHLLQSFMDSPMKLLDTPIKNLLDTPLKTQYEIASCHCVEQISEKDEGPYYTHLGSAPNVASIRESMEKRSGLTGRAIRIEKVIYTGKEGKSTQGCPIAKWVIRRASVEEKLLVLVRERTGHTCETACIIVVILVWEGIAPSLADRLYVELSDTLRKHGALTQRRCALNEERTCACQGLDPEVCGASFSFGCSWSMYYNGCKFARSKIPRKFKLLGDDVKEEEKIDSNLQNLATLLGPLYKTLAPEAYGNQVEHEHRAPDCRLGLKEGRPFSGVTACLDFCAHAHRDLHNMQGGSTVVCTLTREDNREIGKIPEDEQLHVLPLYKASNTDEFGSEEGQQEKVKSGAIQVLSAFRRQVRMLAEPAKSCRQKKLDAKKAAANKNAMLEANDKQEKAMQAKSKAGTYENTTHSTTTAGIVPGAVGATLQSGQLTHPLGAHHQQLQQQRHQSVLPPYPGSKNSPSYPRFPNHPGSFPTTSKPGGMYPLQPPTPANPYPSPLHVPNSYINGSNRPYPGYQCNGGMPLDNYHPYYASNPKHLDMYRQQRPTLYSERQYGVHPRYDVNYPPRYGEPALQVNGYSACSMRPVHPMRSFPPFGPNGAANPQFMDPLSRAPSAHEGLDFTAAVSKGNQFGGYPSPYLSQSPQILGPGQDPFHMQIKTEMGTPGPQMLPAQLSGGCLNPETQLGLGLPNGIKPEPGTPQTPTTPQKPELWSDNEHNFLDPDIGGVAVAPTHGSVLIECAKRELHATTPLKNPDRNHPTRISLVFYQHKNMNEAKHGLALWEAKMAEKAREKEEDAERNGGEGTPSKSSKKGVKREHQESSETMGTPPYKRFIQALMEGSLSCTTNTFVSSSPYAFTKVTGPYSQFV